MSESGENSTPPPEHPEPDDVLRLFDIKADDMTDEDVREIAEALAAETPTDNPLYNDIPALWRAFALLELFRILPNPEDLRTYETSILKRSDFDTILETLWGVEVIRDGANNLAIKVTDAYLTLTEMNDASDMAARNADYTLEQLRKTNIARALRFIRETGSIDPRELLLTEHILGLVMKI